MNKTFSKTSVFLIVLILCVMLIAGCSESKKIPIVFTYVSREEDTSGNASYLLLNNGRRVYGDEVIWNSRKVPKGKIKIGDQDFDISGVKGYRQGTFFFARLGNGYVRRLIHGARINIYSGFGRGVSHTVSASGETSAYESPMTVYYGQKGDDGAFVLIDSKSAIKSLVSDCPVAMAMADISSRQWLKATSDNLHYVSQLFEKYNNGCK